MRTFSRLKTSVYCLVYSKTRHETVHYLVNLLLVWEVFLTDKADFSKLNILMLTALAL